jgi:hypothetical protein
LVDYDSEREIDGARSSLLQEQRRKKMSEKWLAAELSVVGEVEEALGIAFYRPERGCYANVR